MKPNNYPFLKTKFDSKFSKLASIGGFWKFSVSVFLFLQFFLFVSLNSYAQTFNAATNYTAGGNLRFVATADFNGDGKKDLATANGPANSVSIFLNNGSGLFGAATNISVGAHPFCVVSTDLNGDGKQDLLTANYSSDNVTVLLGNGNGTFGSATNFATEHQPQSITMADFNGDGKLDIATANSGSTNLSILLGNGAGGFAAATSVATGVITANYISNGDYNGDGKIDLAITGGASNTVRIHLGNGNGTFTLGVSLATGSGPSANVSSDLNGDGKLDIAVTNFNDNTVIVFLGNGTGTFNSGTSFPVGGMPNGLIAADLNGDSKLDLATANWLSNDVTTIIGNGAGSFASPTSFAAGQSADAVVVADFNSDGRVDMAASNYFTSNVSVFLNTSPILATGLSFDGQNDYISAGTSLNAVLDNANSITAEAWIFPTSLTSAAGNSLGCIIGNYWTLNNGMQFLLRRDNNTIVFYVDLGSGFIGVSTPPLIVLNQWQHIAGVWDGSTIKIYINGVLQASTAAVGTSLGSHSTNPVLVGTNFFNNGGAPEIFTGKLDEVRLWTRALCQGEIQSKMNCELGSGQNNLLLNYHLNTGSPNVNNAGLTTATDASGNGYNGTLINFNLSGATSNWAVGNASGSCSAAYTGLPITIAASSTSVCSGGSSTLTASGASTYVWSPGGSTGNTLVVSPTSTTTYTVLATSSGGCSSSSSITITLSIPSISISSTNPSLCGGDGLALATVSQGTAPYSYNWSTSATSSGISGLSGGTYTVTVSDSKSCVVSKSITLTDPPSVTPTAVNDQYSTCKNTAVTITSASVLSNDITSNNASLLIQSFTQPSNGTVSQDASGNFVFTPASNFTGTTSFNYTIKKNDGKIAFSGNGHYYEYIQNSITWTDAKNAASASSYLGMQGYLTTITSAAENNFVGAKLAGNGWLGASDLAEEGVWRWVTGPEGLEEGGLGRHFSDQYKYDWCGASTAPGINGYYANWQGGEPNDCGADVGVYDPTDQSRPGEHVAHFYGVGTWNDFPDDAGVDGYVVEYGGLEPCTPTLTSTGTITISVNPSSASISAAGSTSLCQGSSLLLNANQTTGNTYQWKLNGNNINSATNSSYLATTAGSYTAVVTSSAGCSATSNAIVITINTLPVISCPSNITVNNALSKCGANVSFNTTSTGTPTPTITYSQASGSFFAVGTTTVTATATNLCGSSTCTFTVTVNDNEAPGGSVNSFPAPVLALTNVSEASQYNVVYALDVPLAADWNVPSNVPYTVNNVSALTGSSYNRVAYMMQLNNTWVWVSFDAFSSNLANLGIPTDFVAQQKVNNMNVFSNSASITAGTGITTGNIEFWSDCYGTQAGNASIPSGNNNLYDFNDNHSSPDCYGSFQIHNYGLSQSLINYDRWSGGGNSDIGIGNQVGGSGHPDWTFAQNTANFSTRKIYVLVNNASTLACSNKTVYLDASGNANISASDLDGGFTDNCEISTITASKTAFTCSNKGANNVVVTVTDIHGNSGSCTSVVTVLDTIRPVINCPSNIVVNNDAGSCGARVSFTASATDNCSATITYSPLSGSFFNLGTTTVTSTATDPSGNTRVCTFTVTVNSPEINVTGNAISILDGDNSASATDGSDFGTPYPNVSVTHTFSIENNGTSSLDISSLSMSGANASNFTIGGITTPTSIAAGSSATFTVQFVAPIIGVYNAVVNINNNDCNESGYDYAVKGEVTCAPAAFVSCPSNKSVNTDLDQCGATVSYLAPVSGAPTPSVSYTFSGATTGSGTGTGSGSTFNLGVTTVTISALNPCGNPTCTFTVTVTDKQKPNVLCKNITVYLNPITGMASITAADVDNGSTDNCQIASMNVSPSLFSCSKVGPNVVTLCIKDANGNLSACKPTVTVVDSTPPVAKSKNICVYLDSSGNVSINASQVNSGSTDVCGIKSMTVSPSSFTCSNIGANSVILTLTDYSGNISTCTSIVTVKDKIKPIARFKDITVYLNPITGFASITAADVDNGSTDNCQIASMKVSPSFFTCSKVGPNVVSFCVKDASGNLSACNPTVTVVDNTPPVAKCKNICVYLDSSGNVSINASQVNSGSTDVCGIKSMTVSPSSFTCSNIGANSVTLTLTDYSGNISTCSSIVTVKDKIKPIARFKDITVYLSPITGFASIAAADVDNGSTDNCQIASMKVSPSFFTCSKVGPNVVSFCVKDASGNLSACSPTVTVVDNTPPVAKCKNICVYLDSSGNVSINASQVNNGSTDVCGIKSMTVSPSSFTCSNLGDNNVVLTLVDNSGNISTCNSIVKVKDLIAPIAVCKNYTVTLLNGEASITASDVDGGSTDNCGINSMSVSPSNFSCANIGANPVILTMNDVSGNTSTCNAIVTVIGAIPTPNVSQSTLPAFCQGRAILLTANEPTAVSYSWSTGATTNPANAYSSGTYSVMVTNQYGCKASASSTVIYNAETLLSAYTLIATNKVEMEADTVFSGSIGVMAVNGQASFKEKSNVTAVGSFVKAKTISTASGSIVSNKILSPAIGISLPAFENNTSSSSTDVNVADFSTSVLAGSVYRDIKLGKGSSVQFTQVVVNIRSLQTKDSGKDNDCHGSHNGVSNTHGSNNHGSNHTTTHGSHGSHAIHSVDTSFSIIRFAQCTKLRVSQDVKIGKRTILNPDMLGLVMYVAGTTEVSEGSYVNSSIYNLKDLHVKESKSCDPVEMRGMFIAKNINGDDNANWYSDTTHCGNCVPVGPLVRIANESKDQSNQFMGKVGARIESIPNPFSDKTNIRFSLLNDDSKVNLVVYDLQGRVISTLFNGKAEAGETYNLQFNGEALSEGTYIYKMYTSTGIYTGKIILIR